MGVAPSGENIAGCFFVVRIPTPTLALLCLQTVSMKATDGAMVLCLIVSVKHVCEGNRGRKGLLKYI